MKYVWVISVVALLGASCSSASDSAPESEESSTPLTVTSVIETQSQPVAASTTTAVPTTTTTVAPTTTTAVPTTAPTVAPTTTTAVPTTMATIPQGGRIADLTECDMGSMEITLFIAKTVPANEVKLIEEQVCLSKELYFDRPGTNWEMASPIYVALIDRDNSEGAVELETLYCNYILEHHPTGWSNGKCGPYGGQGCQTSGKCLFTDDSGKVGGSCICSNFRHDGFYLYTNMSHEMPRHEKGYRSTALHELFHVYQLSSIADPSISKDAEYRLMGKRMGNSSVDVPWWMEGTATYLAHYFYDQQPGAVANSLYNEMRRYLTTDYNGSGLGPIPDQYKNAGKPLTEFTFQEPDKTVAYRMGAWFVAFLVDQVGIDTIFDFYAGLEEAGSFDAQFLAKFGKSHTAFLDDFDAFLEKPYDEKMAIIPS